ncbi:MAG: Gfo/Idh/MocA family oxidoreductase [Planctomycetota bacterium]
MPLPDIDYRPLVPKTSLRIGVLGAGGIVRDAHLPAYRKAGFSLSAICDVREDAAREAARRFGIDGVETDPRALVERQDVDVIDMAIPDAGRLEIVKAAVAAGKHLLIQKPLAHDIDVAREIVRIARDGKVFLAVNQNARWAPEFRAVHSLIRGGHLGHVYLIHWEMRNWADSQPWAKDSWYGTEEKFQILMWTIHHLDLVRYWMGEEPVRLYASLPTRPEQNMRGDVVSSVVMDFAGGQHANVLDNNASLVGRDVHQYFGIEGTRGLVEGDVAKTDPIVVRLAAEPYAVFRPPLEGQWYPDGFIGSMGDLLDAIEKGRSPEVTGEDHIGTLQLVTAAYASAAEGRAVAPSDY